MVNYQTGKKILKGKTLRHWTLMTFFLGGLILILGWLWIKIYLISKQIYPFNITDYFLIAGFAFFWVGMRVMISYIKVYEKGVKVRWNSWVKYIFTRFIPYHQIYDVYLKGKSYPHLIIQLENEQVVVPTILIKNYRDIVKEITNHIDLFKKMKTA